MDISLGNKFSDHSDHQQIFLWGMPGAGKSTSGKQLAHRLGLNFTDLDHKIVAAAGRSIPEIMASDGEESFRNIEQKALHTFLNSGSGVLACGGGTPCFFDNAHRMVDAGRCIYLKATPAFLVSRLRQSKSKRPLLEGVTDLEGELTRVLEQRMKFFEMAHEVIQIP